MAERSGLGWSLAFILLRVLSPAGNSLHLTGNKLPGLSTTSWVCQLGTPADHHGPFRHHRKTLALGLHPPPSN